LHSFRAQAEQANNQNASCRDTEVIELIPKLEAAHIGDCSAGAEEYQYEVDAEVPKLA
jgi:hypothetical protein